ncbi:hypothetical protein ACM01_00125 [Streptomyces viridochromogenes]|uniref:Uncharacterized protein n=1 Tax=Streptomyces viridochromogenes TaxID=1938 RepID=A0A0J7ZPN5_STRVR|nr:hypothetical protein [Streptomyces viridochromogenes]KMS77093.1 hypothetical protein ACM01_00125 [Streptomyces viridochromogenes]KOG09336.1 hypothetical protein ADK35_39870 [Streptomyces viridochromogenes]KOG27243.1 hypothetical protein ADK36_01435 [Streptomyces viridochromogenes]
MNCSSRFLCALYIATSAGLAWTSVLEVRYGPAWAACLFAAASIVPVIAVVRETVIGEQRRWLLELVARAGRGSEGGGDAAEAIVRAELDSACCERWWTSLGSEHDVTCRHGMPRSSSAA